MSSSVVESAILRSSIKNGIYNNCNCNCNVLFDVLCEECLVRRKKEVADVAAQLLAEFDVVDRISLLLVEHALDLRVESLSANQSINQLKERG
jgi:hypothetical protein